MNLFRWEYMTVAVLALAVGLVIGWYVARRRKLGPDTDHRSLFMQATSGLLILLAIGSVLQIFYFQREQAKLTEQLTTTTDCQYQVNKTLIDVLTNRQDPTQQRDKILVDMAKAMLTAESREDSDEALRRFIDATDKLNATRASNPYPTIPSDCRPF